MRTTYRTWITKVIVLFCFCLAAEGVMAQSYETILNTDGRYTRNMDILELNNYFYLLSVAWNEEGYALDTKSSITIFDEHLNKIEQIPLPDIGTFFWASYFFYNDNFWYIFGNDVKEYKYKPCLLILDDNFELVQKRQFAMDDNERYSYSCSNIVMTEKQDFVFMAVEYNGRFSRLFHINNKGEVLQDLFLPYNFTFSSIIAIDSHYYLDDVYKDERLLKIRKDSFDDNEWVSRERKSNECTDGVGISVDNQLITANSYALYCIEDETRIEVDVSIAFFNDDFSVKKRLVVGNSCKDDELSKMHYVNPDSIYCVYRTYTEYGLTFSLACFSSDGTLHFSQMLDLPTPEGAFYFRQVVRVRALSNGGVLVNGMLCDYSQFEETGFVGDNGFLLYYHPTKEVSVKEPLAMEEWRVYPNPVRNQLQITSSELQDHAAYSIYSIVGQTVMQGNLQDNTINVTSLAKGMYFLKIEDKVVKFLKE